MSKRIIVVGEGQTEQEFCKKILVPHFGALGTSIEWPTIKKSGGGIVSWSALKSQIERHLQQERSAYVTTLLDFYGIKPRHQFPDWEGAQKIKDKSKRLEHLEAAMKNDIAADWRHRFIPYLQLHEFEALLFSDPDKVKQYLAESSKAAEEEWNDIATFPNPELINDNQDTCPARRMSRIIPGYNKVIGGTTLALVIGLENISARCPRFRAWLQGLEQLPGGI